MNAVYFDRGRPFKAYCHFCKQIPVIEIGNKLMLCQAHLDDMREMFKVIGPNVSDCQRGRV